MYGTPGCIFSYINACSNVYKPDTAPSFNGCVYPCQSLVIYRFMGAISHSI